MSLTFTPTSGRADTWGRRKVVPQNVAFDSSYPAGGYAITGAQLKGSASAGRTIEGVQFLGGGAPARLYSFLWDTANDKLRVFRKSGMMSYSPGGGDIKGSTNPAGTEGNADQAAAPTNSALLLAADTFTNFAGTMTPTTQPDVPRNVMITIANDSGDALNLYQGVTTFLITGTDKDGLAQTESVTLTSTGGNKAVANNKFRYVQGVKPFRTVTSVAITNAPDGGLKGSLGVGSRIGLPTPLPTPAYTDILSLTISAARVATGSTVTSAGGVDTTNMAVNVGTIADGADVGIVYHDDGEVATGTDLSAVTAARFLFITL